MSCYSAKYIGNNVLHSTSERHCKTPAGLAAIGECTMYNTSKCEICSRARGADKADEAQNTASRR